MTLITTPDEGIQPQVAVDQAGVLHLVYFKGEATGGDVFYVRRGSNEAAFSRPMRVNSLPGSAIAVGTIRGAQFALGRRGHLHVVWNGSKPSSHHRGVAFWYTRLNEEGTAFEPQRDLVTEATGLDGGGSVAADDQGHVYAVWHAHPAGKPEDEAHRAVFVARSQDDGKTFAKETPALGEATGACACCGLRAVADNGGNVFVLFRGARELVKRDELLILSRNQGVSFEVLQSHPWQVAACPMSGAWLSTSGNGVLAAWETAERVFGARLEAGKTRPARPWRLPGEGNCKHPVAAENAQGQMLFAWTENTGWLKGGRLAWALLDSAGQVQEMGRTNGVSVWGLVAVAPRPDGGFLLFH